MGSVLRGTVMLAALTGGCGGDEGPRGTPPTGETPYQPPSEPTLAASLDLAGVVGFAIGPSGARTTTSTTLYAIEADGTMVVTTVTTSGSDTGTATTQQREEPLGVFDTPLYVVFGYRGVQDEEGRSCWGVILRKSDGALFCYTESGVGAVDADGSGERLFVRSDGSPGGFVRVDMGGAEPTATFLVDADDPSGTWIRELAVNASGDALAHWTTAGDASSGLRAYLAGDGLQNVSALAPSCHWTGPAGEEDDFVYVEHGPMSTDTISMIALRRQAEGAFVADAPVVGPPMPGNGCTVAAVVPGLALVWWSSGAQTNELIELVGNVGAVHPVPGIVDIVDAHATDDAVFVQGVDALGDGAIVRVDLPTFTATTVLPAGEFTLTATSLASSGDLTFAGLRNADGVRVVGTVPAGSDTFTILAEAAPTVTTLARID